MQEDNHTEDAAVFSALTNRTVGAITVGVPQTYRVTILTVVVVASQGLHLAPILGSEDRRLCGLVRRVITLFRPAVFRMTTDFGSIVA